MKREIAQIEDVKQLVDVFYEKVRLDETLGPIFDEVIQDNWPHHLDKMYRFWQTILLGQHTYHGNPFSHHAPLPIYGEHFEIWLSLFHETLDDFFVGDKAAFAKKQSNVMAIMFQHKLANLRGENSNIN